jgi:hypothetical protein
MDTKKIEDLESYFKTENEHWNAFAFETVNKVLQSRLFEDPELPLQIVDKAIDVFIERFETPLAAFHTFTGEMEGLIASQKLLIVKCLYGYLSETEYPDTDLSPILELMKGFKSQLGVEAKPSKPITGNIREALKETVQKELDQLPETLKGMEPIQRLNILCKLIPYVLPKVESVDHREGED